MDKSVKDGYKGFECTSCGYRKKLNYTDDSTELIFLQYQLALKNFYPNRKKAAKFKLVRFDCPKCGEEETFYSSSLEREVSKLDKQDWK